MKKISLINISFGEHSERHVVGLDDVTAIFKDTEQDRLKFVIYCGGDKPEYEIFPGQNDRIFVSYCTYESEENAKTTTTKA